MRAAYKAGQGSGDTGLFGAWLDAKGLHSHGNVLRARLRAEYERGVESNFEPRAEKTRRTVAPADLNREFIERSKRRGKKTAEPEAERAEASAVGIDTGRLRAHLGKGGTLAEFQAGQVRNPDVTDRAKRYRAQGAIMQAKKNCVICGKRGRLPEDPVTSSPRLDVMHLTGNESHGETANLAYGCRPCNARLAAAFKAIGAGRPTKQYNPSRNTVPTFEQYAWAVTQGNREHWVKGVGKVAGGKDEWGAIIHATPKHKRIEYAKRIARKASGTKRAAHEERWNPGGYLSIPREPLPAGVKAYQADYDKGYAAGFRKGKAPSGVSPAFAAGFNDARRRSKSSNPAEVQYTVWNLKTERPLGGWDHRRFFRGPDGLRFAIEAADKHAAETGDVHLVGGTDSAHYYRTDGGRISPNPETRRNSIIWEDDGDTQLIRQAEAARSVEELARLHKYALGRKDRAGILAAVETRAAALGIRHAELTAAHPRQWENPVHLQGMGSYESMPLDQVQPGMKIMYNYGFTATVVSVEPKGKSISLVTRDDKSGNVHTRLKRATTQVVAFWPRETKSNPSGEIWAGSRVVRLWSNDGTRWDGRLYVNQGESATPTHKYGVTRKTIEKWAEKTLAPYGPITKRNPQDSAGALYESFHGKPSDEELLIEEEVHVHENLSVIGRAVECWIDTPSGLRACIEFDQDVNAEPIMLCSAENGRQLYFEGGDQAIDLKSLKMDGEEWLKDRMVLGQFSGPEPQNKGKTRRKHNLTYNTKKDFDKFESIDYQHDLGEDSGVRPYLEYDPRNQHLYITGGQYFIEQPLLETSPGIEN